VFRPSSSHQNKQWIWFSDIDCRVCVCVGVGVHNRALVLMRHPPSHSATATTISLATSCHAEAKSELTACSTLCSFPIAMLYEWLPLLTRLHENGKVCAEDTKAGVRSRSPDLVAMWIDMYQNVSVTHGTRSSPP
jgi:hypothetical protein